MPQNIVRLTVFALVAALATAAAACSAPVDEPTGSHSSKIQSGDPPASDDPTLLASIPIGGDQCLVTDGDCVLHAGGAAGAVAIAAQSCGITFVAAVSVLVCQVGLGGPEDPLADFCSGAAASLASSEAVTCVASVAVSTSTISDMRNACVKSCSKA
jgi:hypothetical protein